MIFNHSGEPVGLHQLEHEQIYPRPGWVEHDPLEIWANTETVVRRALHNAGAVAADIAAVGITNQRETTVVWDRQTGQPYYNAIVWQDTRTDQIIRQLAGNEGMDRFREQVGLPLATYFSGPKISWILENVEGVRQAGEEGRALFGNMDTWLIWNLTGGVNGGKHLTDVTNASRTMLMNLNTLEWDPEICGLMGVPRAMLPKICSSSEIYGQTLDSGPCRRPGRPASRHRGPDLFRTWGSQEHLRHRMLYAPEHRGRDHPVQARAADHLVLPIRGRKAGLRTGRIDCHHRGIGAMAAR
jgi:glycerol kinase